MVDFIVLDVSLGLAITSYVATSVPSVPGTISTILVNKSSPYIE